MSDVFDEMRERHVAILGTTGSGKTATAKRVIVEPILEAKGRCLIIDPTGAWWGLRLKASGQPSHYDVAIFGGDHGDLPLRARDAVVLAEAFGTSSGSAVFDTSLMTVTERCQFFTEFANAILRKNRGPLHFVIDEAHLFMPQAGASVGGQVPAMLHAGNNLVSLGRSKGLRVTMISQRPAKLHKDSLTQAQSLIAMRVIAPQDRKAIAEWIAEQADAAKSKEIVESLSSLKAGEGWAWVPSANYLHRSQFPLPRSYDSSKAPTDDGLGPVLLPPINMEALQGKLSALEAEAKSNDPKALKAEIARLQKEAVLLKQAGGGDVDQAYKDGYATGSDHAAAHAHAEGYLSGIRDGYIKGTEEIGRVLIAHLPNVIAQNVEAAKSAPATMLAKEFQVPPLPKPVAAPTPPQRIERFTRDLKQPDKADLTSPQTKVIRALLFWRGVGQEQPTREQIGGIAGYSPSSGGFSNLLGQLKSKSLIDYPVPGRVSVINSAGMHDVMDADEARQTLRNTLSNPQQKLVDALLARGHALSRAELGEATDYSATSGGFSNLLGQLRSLDVVSYPSQGQVALTDWASEIMGGR